MLIENKDVNGTGENQDAGGDNSSKSSDDNNQGGNGNGGGEGGGEGGEKSVPYARFKEVNDEVKGLKEKLENIEKLQTKQDGGKTLTPEEKKELDAKTYLKGLLKETMEETEKAKKDGEARELKQFNEAVAGVLEINPDIKRDDFLKFVKENESKYKFSSVEGAMAIYKDLNKTKTEAKEQGKKEVINRPKFPSNDGGSAPQTYDVKGKSMSQIAEEAKRELEKS